MIPVLALWWAVAGLVWVVPANVSAIPPNMATAGIPLPGNHSPDVELYESGTIGSWGCQKAYYYVYKVEGYNRWISKIWTDRTGGTCALKYFGGIIWYYSGDMPDTIGTDPYAYLPLNGQTWTYRSDDGFTNGDAVGTLPGQYAQWMALPSTRVPSGVWTAYVTSNRVHWVTGYASCSTGWDNMRQGLASLSGGGNYVSLRVGYNGHTFYCVWPGSDYYDWATKNVHLFL